MHAHKQEAGNPPALALALAVLALIGLGAGCAPAIGQPRMLALGSDRPIHVSASLIEASADPLAPMSPLERQVAMEQLRRQILQKTRHLPDPAYRQVTRPGLARQLRALGFEDPEAAVILESVDQARAWRFGR